MTWMLVTGAVVLATVMLGFALRLLLETLLLKIQVASIRRQYEDELYAEEDVSSSRNERT